MKCESCRAIVTQNEVDEADHAWAATHDGEAPGTTWCPACARALNAAGLLDRIDAAGGAR